MFLFRIWLGEGISCISDSVVIDLFEFDFFMMFSVFFWYRLKLILFMV